MKGWAELFLCAAVMVAGWTRSPLGAVAHNALALAQGSERVDVLASFRTELPERMTTSLARALELPAEAAPDGWSPALRTAIAAHLGEEALAAIVSRPSADPERALEEWAVGATLRDRALRRAEAAGERDPDAYDAHRRFLPAEAAARADRAVTEVQALATALDLRWPVDPEARVTSGFGYRTHPVLGVRKLHEGVDIALPVGTPVGAAGDGRVAGAGEDPVSGRFVAIDHGHGVRTNYCHGESVSVEKGAAVRRGAPVMASGNTGRSTGPHLHFGLRIGGRAVDPAPFLVPRPGAPPPA